MKPIYPCLWFDQNARQAADCYVKAFTSSRIVGDSEIVVMADLAGQKFMLLNGGPRFSPNPSISFYVQCTTEAEISHAWSLLSAGGSTLMPLDRYPWSEKYGWVQDAFGISWQLSLGKMAGVEQKISPVLMFTNRYANQAGKAIQYYTSVFKDSTLISASRYSAGQAGPEGTIQHAQFILGGYVIMAMDSPVEHAFTFNEGISFVVECVTQEEIDYYWDKLTVGGAESMCGWLRDQFGVWWQIIPSVLSELMSDPARAPRVTAAFLKMKKFNIQALINA